MELLKEITPKTKKVKPQPSDEETVAVAVVDCRQ
jgi:hypothetical protein